MTIAIRECNIRIATSEAGLDTGWLLYSWKLPEPTTPVYNDHSVTVDTADGGQALRGFRLVRLYWNRLSDQQCQRLATMIRTVLAADGFLYLTVDKGWNNITYQNNWIDVRGKPHALTIGPAGGTGGTMRDSVELFVNAVTVINDPAVL